MKAVAGDFVGWATSKDMEQKRLAAGIASDIGRTSTMQSEAYKKSVLGVQTGQIFRVNG